MYHRINYSDMWMDIESVLTVFSDSNGITVFLVSKLGVLDGFISDNPKSDEFFYDMQSRFSPLLASAKRELPSIFSESHGTSYFALRYSEGYIICGPVLHSRTEENSFAEQFDESGLSVSQRIKSIDALKYMPVIDYRRMLDNCLLLNALVNRVDMSFEEFVSRRRILYYRTEVVPFEYNRERFPREPYPLELQSRIREAVRGGSDEHVADVIGSLERWNFSFVSKIPIRGYRQTFAVLGGFVMDEAIGCGVEPELAVTLCEYYLNWADNAKTIEELINIFIRMLYDYTKRVGTVRKGGGIGKLTIAFEKYVRSHIEERITLSDAAEQLGVTSQYLCTRIKADTDMTPNRLVHKLKTEEAIKLMADDETMLSELWLRLGYCDQSHFCKVFKEYTGKTLREYKMGL